MQRVQWEGRMLNVLNKTFTSATIPVWSCCKHSLRDLLDALCDVFLQISCRFLFFYHLKRNTSQNKSQLVESMHPDIQAVWGNKQTWISQKVSSNTLWSYCFTLTIFHFTTWWISINLFYPIDSFSVCIIHEEYWSARGYTSVGTHSAVLCHCPVWEQRIKNPFSSIHKSLFIEPHDSFEVRDGFEFCDACVM